MKKIQLFLLAAITVMGLTMCSQNKQGANEEAVDSTAVMPEYPGGMDSLMTYLTNNITYPQQALEVGMEGRVQVNFVVEKDGTISDVVVAESVDSLLDAEAVRVVSNMPTWTPGKDENDNAVRVKYTLPVNFVIPDVTADIDQAPAFPGGQDALVQYLIDNIKYPQSAEEKKAQGRVLVRFIVNEEGRIVDPKVIKSVDEDLDAEALRVVKAMPKWTPGQNGGKAVSVDYTLPVSFVLE